MNKLCLLAPTVLLCACSGFSGMFEDAPPTLADLQPVELPATTKALPQVSAAELAEIYRELLEQLQDPATRLQISQRLADLQMLEAEEQFALADVNAPFFAEAIAAYETLLRDNPDYARQDQVLYQLSKAYSLNGQSDASLAVLERLSQQSAQSPYLPEAYFRQAERQFVDNQYARAEDLYAQVIGYGAQTPFYTRALYMQGWSRFKQDKYHGAIEAFTASLDVLLPADSDGDTDQLPRAEQELVGDSLRVMAIVFSKQAGTETLATSYDTLGPRHYEHLLYESLGMLYLSQERYDDSAGAYQAFIARRPDSRRAHRFQVRVIEAYEAGGFEQLIVGAKQDYVAAFPVTGEYWQQSNSAGQDAIAARLQVYIPELAAHYHASAQAARSSGSADTAQLYGRAAHYYQLYLESFPDDPQVPGLTFLLAESLYEAEDYPAAIAAYEQVAYVYGDPANAADAGYTAILAYGKLIDAAPGDQPGLLRSHIDSELRFQASFPQDPRATAVLGHAANALLGLDDYRGALQAASTLVRLEPAAGKNLTIPAWLVIGHSQFALDHFAAAEAAYRQSLLMLDASDQRTADTTDRLAAAIYRQGESAAAMGESAVAANHFQRVMLAAPASSISVNAQFDAAQALIRAGELQQANVLLRDFRQRHPDHLLTADIGATLLQNYEQLEQWQDAAGELDRMRSADNADADFTRQALIVAARYYDKAGDQSNAIERYRAYAHKWPDPVNENLEAMNRLAELYADAGEAEKRRFWLARTMQAHDGAGAQQSDRSRYLAAHAASELANESFAGFTTLHLTHPIKQSLPAKKQAMERTIAAYNQCNGYAVEQFITLCSYRLGLVYQQFSADLMASERPRGLDAMALEQYDIMLEEQAFPFEEQAIAIHESNALRCREGIYDQWVQQSFASLGELMPARYNKQEKPQIETLPAPSRKVKAFNTEGIALRQQGDFGAAEQAYLAALAASEDDAAAHRNIGILYDLYLGMPDKAVFHYRRYQALTEPGNREVAGWIADLERRQLTVAREAS